MARTYLLGGLFLASFVGWAAERRARRRAELAIARLEANHAAVLRAIPDLLFVLQRDGTYLDCHMREPRALFAPPEAFIGKKIEDVLPQPLAGQLMDALVEASRSSGTVVVDYELAMSDGIRYYEARLVALEGDRVLCIVRDMTGERRAQQRRRDLAGRLIVSQERERARIARELHDGPCQELTAVSIDLGELNRRAEPVEKDQLRSRIRETQARLASLADSLRDISHGLHSAVLDHIGLLASLRAFCAETQRRHGIPVAFLADDIGQVNQPTALAVFRIAQEALLNAVRHGHPQEVRLALNRSNGDIRVVVKDDGVGFDVDMARGSGGLGLVSIEERVHLLKGALSIESRVGEGTIVEVRVPVD